MPIKMIEIIIGVIVIAAFIIPKSMKFIKLRKEAEEHNKLMNSAYVPDPENKNVIVVRGWTHDEIKQILKDFLEQYELPLNTICITSNYNNITLTFPNDIQPDKFCFLVNYIQYPRNFNLETRSICGVGRVILNMAFGVPAPRLIGKSAEIYVPANDTEYDLVYARTDSGETYKISFTDFIWKHAENARRPRDIDHL